MTDWRTRLPNRAHDAMQREDVIIRILDAWDMVPDLRLGQLLENARKNFDLAGIEDFTLLSQVELWVRENAEVIARINQEHRHD